MNHCRALVKSARLVAGCVVCLPWRVSNKSDCAQLVYTDITKKMKKRGGNQKRPLNERPFGFKFLCILLIAEAFDDLLGHACVGEASVVEEVLHSDIFGKVREHADAVVCTSYCAGVAQWRHLL